MTSNKASQGKVEPGAAVWGAPAIENSFGHKWLFAATKTAALAGYAVQSLGTLSAAQPNQREGNKLDLWLTTSGCAATSSSGPVAATAAAGASTELKSTASPIALQTLLPSLTSWTEIGCDNLDLGTERDLAGNPPRRRVHGASLTSPAESLVGLSVKTRGIVAFIDMVQQAVQAAVQQCYPDWGLEI